jgi:acetoin:2,6-dichlorophenolindophenol oxidoreductase subunit beta
VPGLTTVAPSTASDAKGLLLSAMRDDDPVVFFEHKRLYLTSEHVPEEPEPIPFGVARVAREGRDLTIVAVQRCVHFALEAAEVLAADGIEVEVVDPRTYSPRDEATAHDRRGRAGALGGVTLGAGEP